MADLNGQEPVGEVGFVPPGPVEMAISVVQAVTGNGAMAVQMVISTPLGLTNLFFSPGEAIQLAKELNRKGQAGQAGLHLPERAN